MGTSGTRVITPVKVLALFVALVVALAFLPSSAYAGSKTVKKQAFSTSTSVIVKKATNVKKGTTKLTFKKGQGYVKFTAPATKKYKFTFSKVKSKRGASAFVEVQRPDAGSPQYSFLTDVKTKGGTTDTLWLGVNGKKSKSGKMVNRNLTTRSATINLTKGDQIYFYFYSGTKKTTAKLKIK